MVDHLGSDGLAVQFAKIWRELRRISKATLQNSSIGRAVMRFYAGGRIRIEDGGGIDILGSGFLNIDGNLNGDGVLDWSGTVYFRGPTGVQGNFATSGNATIGGATTISGSLNVTGATTLNNTVTMNDDLTVGTGRIVVGNMVIQKTGGFSGEVASSGILYLRGAGIQIDGSVTAQDHFTVLGDFDVLGAKNFKMPHPSKEHVWLRHGSTESPVSGTEYTGRARLGADGSAVVELPEYFEGLNKPGGRTVQLTPVGRPFPVGADEVVDGKVTVYGDPGREVFWLVKAERFGGDFLLEEEIPPAPFSEDQED
ncbi:hypothetical protein AB0E56_13020 [Microbacterium sp. NPDC028030]|uniref:hypothetical protein n=1 Tax=Microbacterium sp. NPDC028030 TaxID=3155124 RepID=UPI0033DD0B32